MSELLAAMRKVEKAKGQPLLEHAWEMAYEDPKLLASLLRKIIPDLQHTSGDTLSPAVLNIIHAYKPAHGTYSPPSSVRDATGRDG